MKLLKKREYTEEEQKLKKLNRRLSLVRYVLLIGFLLVFNAYAWFIYVSRVQTQMDLHVLSWNITFTVDNTSVKNVNLLVDIYPGMEDYSNTVEITNGSETSARLSFDTKSVTLFGQELVTSSETEAQKEDKLENDFPFKVILTSSEDVIGVQRVATFEIEVKWAYEADEYYKVPSIFEYDDELTYYTKSGETYTEDDTVTSSNYSTKASSLYLFKDDIDSYIGEKCGQYVKANNTNCLKISGDLVAEQA